MEFDDQMTSLVHDPDSLMEMTRAFSLPGAEPFDVVGIDAEWKPENYYGVRRAARRKGKRSLRERIKRKIKKLFQKLRHEEDRQATEVVVQRNGGRKKKKRGGSSSPVALLQISTRTRCWVLDLQSLCLAFPGGGIGEKMLTANTLLSEEEKLVDTALGKIFADQGVLKLGLGPAADLKRLSWSYPHLPCFRAFNSVLDLSTLAKKAYPDVSSRSMEGLNKLCQHQLSYAIDKSMQCSDWSQRPLSKEQLKYASLDAYVLILLFDSITATLRGAVEAEQEPCIATKKNRKQSKSPESVVRSLAVSYEVGSIYQQAEQELSRRRAEEEEAEAGRVAIISSASPGKGEEPSAMEQGMVAVIAQDTAARPLVALRQVQMRTKPMKI